MGAKHFLCRRPEGVWECRGELARRGFRWYETRAFRFTGWDRFRVREERKRARPVGGQLIMRIENEVGGTDSDAGLFDEPHPRERINAGRPVRLARA